MGMALSAVVTVRAVGVHSIAMARRNHSLWTDSGLEVENVFCIKSVDGHYVVLNQNPTAQHSLSTTNCNMISIAIIREL